MLGFCHLRDGLTQRLPWKEAVAIVLTVAMAGCTSQVVDASASALATSNVTAFIHDMVDARAAALQSGDAAAYRQFFAPSAWVAHDPALMNDDPDAIERRGSGLETTDLTILAVNSEVRDLAVVMEGDQLVVTYTIDTTTQFATADMANPSPAEELDTYQAVVDIHDGKPVIVDLYLLPDGVNRFERTDGPSTPGPDDLGIAPTVEGGSEPDQSVVPFLYMTSLATAYADKYALNYNSKFRTFFGDCTNFVSQCLLAAYRPMIWGNGDKAAPNLWWYDFSWLGTQSYTWGGAKNFFTHITAYSSGLSVASTAYIQPGDLLFADWEGDYVIDHVMIVAARICSGSSWSCILIDQHTNNRYHYPVSSTMSGYPNIRLYAVRPIF